MKYTILTLLFAFAALMISCSDAELFPAGSSGELSDYDIPEGIRSGYSLNMAVSLASMSGGASTTIDAYLEEMENYIAPDKFRVLFFDSNDKFLFESRSRWVKKLDASSSNSRWLVSVPVFTYGNDVYKDDAGNDLEYDWETIREILQTDSFKVAILANRPELEWYPSFSDLPDLPAHWFDNRGPFWDPRDFRQRDIFDLHHCQYDPVYHGKSKADGMYDFIMGDWDAVLTYVDKKPTMGATSSWVNWGKRDSDSGDGGNIHGWLNKDDKNGNDQLKSFILPSQEYPIPMYGVQRFAPITQNWVKGMPFNLSDIAKKWKGTEGSEGNDTQEEDEYEYKNVSLLRSVVRLELRIPKSHPTTGEAIDKPDFVAMCYPNIYARCEPMDVWTPTDELWRTQHDNNNTNCEISAILNYGPISRSTDPVSSAKIDYQNRISWLYGAWIEDGKWTFQGGNGSAITNYLNTLDVYKPYPRIFNPCIQRNLMVICDEFGDLTDQINDGFYNYVVYVGERNVNDPTNLSQLGNPDNGAPTIQYWMFNIKDQVYGMPITDYSNPLNPVYRDGILDSENYEEYDTIGKHANHSAMNGAYQKAIQKETSPDRLPWPLIRNHVYRLTVTPKANQNALAYSGKLIDGVLPWPPSRLFLNNDSKWSNPGTGILDYGALKNHTAGSSDVVWGQTLTRNSSSPFSSGNALTINGGEYQTIKTGMGENDRQTKLTLPSGKIIKKVTLYAYANVKLANSAIKYTATKWAVSNIGNASKSTIKNSSGVSLLDVTFGSPSEGWITGDGNVSVTYGGSTHTFSTYATTKDTNGSGSASLATDGSSAYNYIAFTPKVDGTVVVVVHNVGTGKTTAIYEDGMPKDAVAIGTGSDYAPFTGGADLSKAIGSSSAYSGGVKIDVTAGKNYTFSVAGSKGRLSGIVFYQMGDNPYYWEEVGGRSYTAAETGITTFSDQSAYNVFETTDIGPTPNEFTFTNSNSGTQLAFVAFVETENSNGEPEYWELLENPNGPIMADDAEIRELQGLKISDTSGSVRIYDVEPGMVQLTGPATITIPRQADGHIITFVGKSADPTATNRGIKAVSTQLECLSENTGGECYFNGDVVSTFQWEVHTTGNPIDVQFQLINGGINFYEIRIDSPSTSRGVAKEDDGPAIKVTSEKRYPKNL